MNPVTKFNEMTVQVAACLNPERVRDTLNEHIRWPEGGCVDRVQIKRFMPRRGGRFDIEYRVEITVPGQSQLRDGSIFARIPERRGGEVPASYDVSWCPNGIANAWAPVEDLGATLHTADRDPGLPQFKTAFNSSRIEADLHNWVRANKQESDDCPSLTKSELLTMRPGRRFVMRYTFGSVESTTSALAAKFFADNRGSTISRMHARLEPFLDQFSNGRARLTPILGYDSSLRMLVTQWIDGCEDSHTHHNAKKMARGAALVLASLHSAPVTVTDHCDPRNTWDVVSRWFHTLDLFAPNTAERLRTTIKALNAARAAMPTLTNALVHRDFYDAQLVLQDDGVTLLDLDTLSRGDRHGDVANYLAHLWLTCLQTECPSHWYANAASEFLAEYESLTEPLHNRALAFHWALSLFRVAAIHCFRDKTGQFATRLFAAVDPVLESGRAVLESDTFEPIGACNTTERTIDQPQRLARDPVSHNGHRRKQAP